MSDNLVSLMERLGYEFTAPALLEEALIHASANQGKNNEQLEFLGDRVLGLVIAEELRRKYPNEKEGDWAKRMSSLVSRATCAEIAGACDLGTALVIGKKYSKPSLSENMLSNLCEAVIAAIYLDGGLNAARDFILRHWQVVFDNMIDVPQNVKAALQEFCQAHEFGLPIYKKISLTGAAHRPFITVEVRLENGMKAQAGGNSRREAEAMAAHILLDELHKVMAPEDDSSKNDGQNNGQNNGKSDGIL